MKANKKHQDMEINEQEFTRLVKQHKETIYSVCLMYAEDQDEANDLMQEALINLWQGLPSWRGDCELRSWIWRVRMNTCINQDVKKRRRQEHQPEVEDLLTPRSEDHKQIMALHRRIRRLKPFDRAIILLWLEDLPYEEIGKVVGISAKNVSVRLVRIREELKQMTD